MPWRAVRSMIAAAVLVVATAPHWPEAVDDVYITAAYAHEWVQTGVLRWTSGEVVEGYSNFLMLVYMAAVAMCGGDVGLWSQLAALASGVAILCLLSWLLPTNWRGWVAILGVAACAPLARWSGQGMETTLYALLVSIAWVASVRRGWSWGLGVAVMALASVTRPEGIGLLGLVIAGGWLPWNRHRRHWVVAVTALAGLVVYHVLRVAHFGALWPTSVLVKIGGASWGLPGLAQAAGDVACFAGPFVAFAFVLRPQSKAKLLWAMVPFAYQAIVLIRASGDWMGWARLTLPGMVASLAAVAAISSPRRAGVGVSLGVVVGAAAGLLFEPLGYGQMDLALRPLVPISTALQSYRNGLYTPLDADVAWAAENLHSGAVFMAVDAGMLGNLPDVELVDIRGLTHRRSAEAIADRTVSTWFIETVSSQETSPSWVRIANWDGKQEPSVPAEMRARFDLAASLTYPRGTTWWYTTTDRRADAALAADRLKALHARYPSQPFLARAASQALARDGRLHEAIAVDRRAHQRWPDRAEFGAAPASLSFVTGSAPLTWVANRGFALYWNAELTSTPLDAAAFSTAVLQLEEDPAGDAAARVAVRVHGGCERALEVDVVGRTTLPLAELGCGVPTSGEHTIVTVAFLNDEVLDDADRNVYIWLELAPY